jgi:hypothetical protein
VTGPPCANQRSSTGQSVLLASDQWRPYARQTSFVAKSGCKTPPGRLRQTDRQTFCRMFGSPISSAALVQPAAVSLLAAATPILDRWGRWYLFGAQAVALHGVPRLSADVDVTLALVPDAPDLFSRDMAGAGFSLRVTDPDFIRRMRVIPFVHTETGMPLDVVLAGSGLEDEFLGRARAVVVGGATVPVIDVEDLIIAKVLASRPKDVEDATALWRLHKGTLRPRRITETLRLLEQALAQSDLLPVFERIREIE